MAQPMPSDRLSTHTCRQCGKRWTRKAHHGQQPKWCSVTCRELGKKGAAGVCERCDRPYFGTGKRFCSKRCAGVIKPASPGPNAIKAAYVAEDWDLVLRLIRGMCQLDEASGCWVWSGRVDSHGYPSIPRDKRSKRTGLVHRVALEAKFQAPLGQQPAHHMCANIKCVNPEHLEPVTHAANIAEMLGRQAYLRRIRDLEAALAEASPGHPLLVLVPVT